MLSPVLESLTNTQTCQCKWRNLKQYVKKLAAGWTVQEHVDDVAVEPYAAAFFDLPPSFLVEIGRARCSVYCSYDVYADFQELYRLVNSSKNEGKHTHTHTHTHTQTHSLPLS